MNNEDKYFRTDSGLTRFKYETIAAVTKKENGDVEVHLCSGTIFTIITRMVPFLEWYDYMGEVQ
tara:strand:- start:130 stop:321 length:192 start_codon:yes stop_codon:yes gene_type:complete